jgi:hypothetical protein
MRPQQVAAEYNLDSIAYFDAPDKGQVAGPKSTGYH